VCIPVRHGKLRGDDRRDPAFEERRGDRAAGWILGLPASRGFTSVQEYKPDFLLDQKIGEIDSIERRRLLARTMELKITLLPLRIVGGVAEEMQNIVPII